MYSVLPVVIKKDVVSPTAPVRIAPFVWTSAGLKAVTVAGETRTPVAVSLRYGRCTTLGAESADIYVGAGISDEINEHAVGVYGDDNVSTTDEESVFDTVAAVLPNSILSATLTSGGAGFKVGGMDINVTTITGTIRGYAKFYFADAAEVVSVDFGGNGATNQGAVNFTGKVGFVEVIHGNGLTAGNDLADRIISVGYGHGTTSSVVAQVCVTLTGDNGRNGSKRECEWFTDRIGHSENNGPIYGIVTLDDFTASGVDLTVTNDGNQDWGVLMVAFPGSTDAWVGEVDAPPNSGDWEGVSGGIGFVPQAAGLAATHTDNTAGSRVTEYATGDEASVYAESVQDAGGAWCVAMRAGDGSPVQYKTRVSEQLMLWSYGGQGGSGTAYDVDATSLTNKLFEAAAGSVATAQSTARKMVGWALAA